MAAVVVVGASIAGLSAAVLLRRAGHVVRIIERAAAAPTDRGAGLGVEPELVESIVGTAATQGLETFVLERRLGYQAEAYDGSPPRRVDVDAAPARLHVTSWARLHALLLHAWGNEPEYGNTVDSVRQDDAGAELALANRRTIVAEAVIGADGHRSRVAAAVAAEPPRPYAGYLLWRGFIDAQLVSPALRRRFADGSLHVFSRWPHHMVVYAVPGPKPGEVGATCLNWGWYLAASSDSVRGTLGLDAADEETIVVPAQRVPESRLNAQLHLARRVWPVDWAALVCESAFAHCMFVNVVREGIVQRPARGRVLLSGDAAHLLSPITGSGARLALLDAQIAAHAGTRARVTGWPAAAAEYARAVQARADAAAAPAREWAQRALGVQYPTGMRAERACGGAGHAG